MDLEELRKRLKGFDLGEIKPTKHAFERIQDKRRKINYPLIIKYLTSNEGPYKFEEQEPLFPDELKFKLWFKLNYLLDLILYISFNRNIKEKGLNKLNIISTHKVRRDIQKRLNIKK